MATKTKIELALELGRSMAELKNHLRRNTQVRIRDNGLNITFEMLEIMSCLWKKDGINQQEIANMTLRNKSSMTNVIDNLVKRNLVKRLEDENDRRNKLIYLTEEGKALNEQLHPWVAEIYDIAIPDVDIKSMEDSIALLNKMIENLKNRLN